MSWVRPNRTHAPSNIPSPFVTASHGNKRGIGNATPISTANIPRKYSETRRGAPAGFIRLAPLARCGKQAEKLSWLASLLAVEARHRLAGVVRTLEAENAGTSALRMLPQPKTSQTHSRAELAKNSCVPVEPASAHPLCCDCEPCLNGDHHG